MSAGKGEANQIHEESTGAKYDSGYGQYTFGIKLASVEEEEKCQ